MPIYEFRCLKCHDIFELLMVGEGDKVEMKCPKCNSEEFERVLSSTSYSVGFSRGESRRPRVQSRECAAGSCSTVELPGYSKD